ncbi:MAG TPA: alpha-glucuronidase family glycosyl hydrolase [Chitinophagaceae bacterium]|nr:alpha-glucuronidase family glycosyl hydrolase [Chitinophagaceae bacterium]HQV84317.1 alpha-glucuronidase family glycosyl hydrolase [Chitinophagaceae bacterium]HQX71591.1 alpha-glucuronidase family glycosyl hydrolase [Chitinophagaceae bacterium]
MKKLLLLLFLFSSFEYLNAENGYDLWLRYKTIDNKQLLHLYRQQITGLTIHGSSPTITAAKEELSLGLQGLLQIKIPFTSGTHQKGTVLAGTPSSSPSIRQLGLTSYLRQTGSEGFIIMTKKINGNNCIVITANTDTGILYGVFHFLRLLQTHQPVSPLNIISFPRLKLRLLNHWDNLNRTVERGYAGFSIWNWHTLPGYIDKRYIDYARANASVGINGTVLTNVNANATILTEPYLQKVKALAEVFRPYGIKVYLTARFSAPIELGGLKTADPLNEEVQQWWKQKTKEIYSLIPDFGGFLVKANSEGQPGPQDYKRTHADGANMLADAVAPYNGIVIWRAFVYAAENPVDRHKQAYDDFVPLDGQFRKNVMVQVKNGAIDFMPREPFHPLFGAMPKTPLMMEFQVTQEYLGQGTNLVYLAPLFKEVLESDTYCKGKGSTVAKVIDGSLDNHSLNGMAGVANIGNDINWCGHPFAQANWYALGRLSWDYTLSSEQIAEEWLRMSYINNYSFVANAKEIMMHSRDIYVQFTNPIGLHHIMGTGHHYGPAPWVSNLNRPEWNPVYYHKADSIGIGFNRTSTGSNAIAQYFPEARKQWEDINSCEEKNLLWFHHVPWNHKMKSGRTVWEELCHHYYTGADRVKQMKQKWVALKPFVDKDRYEQVMQLLNVQHEEAIWWRNGCLLYFQTFSKQPIPAAYEQPDKTLEYYKSLRFPFAPGN